MLKELNNDAIVSDYICTVGAVEHDLVVYLLTKAEHFDPDRASINTFVARRQFSRGHVGS